MSQQVLKTLRSADHVAHLRDLLLCHLGINADTYKREANGSATADEVAKLIAFRFLFGEDLIEDHEPSKAQQSRAILWLRRQKVGRMTRDILLEVISQTRYTYETTPANEATRLLLLAYKQIKVILYDKDLGEVLC